MQPLGYYGLNLDTSTELKIDGLSTSEMTDLLDDLTSALNYNHYLAADTLIELQPAPLNVDDLTDLHKIALCRALCDRIEIKIMEIAK